MGGSGGFAKVINERLGVVHIVVHHAGKRALKFGVMRVEPFFNEQGVVVVFGKDNGFAQDPRKAERVKIGCSDVRCFAASPFGLC